MCLTSLVLFTQYERSTDWMIFLSTLFFKKIGQLFRIPLGKMGVNIYKHTHICIYIIVYKNDKCGVFFLFHCLLHCPPPFKANTLDAANKPINEPKTNKK